MAESRGIEPEALAAALVTLAGWAEEHAPAPEPEVRRRLREHLGADPAGLEVVSHALGRYDQVNFQVALDRHVADTGVRTEVLGLPLDHGFRAGLAELAQGASRWGPLEPGPVEHVPVDVGDREVLCTKAGLVLLDEPDGPVALLLVSPDRDERGGIVLEVMATERVQAEAWLSRLRAVMDEHNVYQGKVLAFGESHPFRAAPLSVRQLPEVRRERIVLPDGTLDRVERHAVAMSRHSDALRAQGRHLKRGMLLHGPPGTGKTLTVMYLASLMPGRTTVLLSGEALGALGAGVALARSLEPATVVIEDVDLIARERSHALASPLLFALLNAMEGLDGDADVLFVLTTNRPEVLEPALASRPGRVDLAVELPLPDAVARRRLLELYAEGLELDAPDWDAVVAATEGTSPAFVRELMRRAALEAAEAGGRVGTDALLTAVDVLRVQSGRLTATLLGAERPQLDDLADLEDDEDDDDFEIEFDDFGLRP